MVGRACTGEDIDYLASRAGAAARRAGEQEPAAGAPMSPEASKPGHSRKGRKDAVTVDDDIPF